jgi:hypothetical protein
MTDPHGPPDAAGSQPTQPFWLGPDPGSANPHPTTPPGAAPAASQVPGFGEHLNRDRRMALRWTVGLLVAALLAGGGILAGLSLAGHSSPAADLGQASAADAHQAGLLRSALNSANSPGALTTALGATAWSGASAANGTQAGAAGPGAPGTLCARARGVASAAGQAGLPRLARRIGLGAARCRLFRHRVFTFLLLRGVAGQFTVQTGQGTKTLAYQRGVIQTVDAGRSVVVEATNGTTWTWDLVSTTVVRDLQGRVSESDLAAGTPVWVGGPVAQGAKDARLIVLRPPLPAAASPSATPGN